ncbi:Threonine/homoserine/homoserine lactone efflux protein [Pseudovibrio denitrificans]|uniref:Threonine/homoserine/homoserine lactone efflux protein n=1 Tax=Pseudovibrio denitrificans TaxID=258256 RepID=A0A1I6XE58_9HYPH|nr:MULTISPECIES: LysE family translocator [Pseudovibrio]EEA96395.1 homoserine/homoserine lactone efflux protein [Pseudovibrio sp. JE062]SFT36608.1 Threonine/homoserine/homoserine lactone efflux protein [Pseudovibrio denitrificans]
MAVEVWLTYVIACIILLIIPGPTVLMVSSYGISQGLRAVIASALGVSLGSILLISVALAGLGAVISTSALLYDLLQYAGATYLIYLGISMWRRKSVVKGQLEITATSRFHIFRDTFLVSAFNPKDMLFFVAFLPQFVDDTVPVIPQFVLLGVTFVVLGGINTMFWTSMAGSCRTMLMGGKSARRLNRIGGTGLLSAGLFIALSGKFP